LAVQGHLLTACRLVGRVVVRPTTVASSTLRRKAISATIPPHCGGSLCAARIDWQGWSRRRRFCRCSASQAAAGPALRHPKVRPRRQADEVRAYSWRRSGKGSPDSSCGPGTPGNRKLRTEKL